MNCQPPYIDLISLAESRVGFPDELLSDTFALASTGNGLLGVVAGIMAQWLADRLGNIGPFQAAIAHVS